MASHYHKPHDDATTYIALLKACVPKKELEKCKRIHAEIIRNGLLQKNACVGSTLVNVYAKCGALSKARDVFDQICVKDVVSWTALISGYAKQGQGNEALHCFDMMVRDGISPNSVTFLSILKACGSIGSLEKGEEMHGHVIKEGLLGKDILLGSAVVDMYTKCGAMSKAQEVFDQLPIQDVVCWNALISGYAQHGPGEKALSCLDRMQRQGVSPDVVTFVCILKACCSIRAFEKGKEIHAEILKEGLLEKHVLVGNALVNMYTKCGELAKAQEVFDGLPNLNIVSWNAFIAGYAQHGYGDEALNHCINMRNQGFCPNAVTFVCILKACGGLGKLQKGKEIHAEVIEHDCLGKNMFIATGLVDMYAKCGEISNAREVFDEFTIQEVVSCNALIAGCIQYGHDEKALQCFIRMQHESLLPDTYTFACILKCCGSIGAIDKGKEIHAKIINEEILMKSALICTALVDMYAKCGVLTEAQKVFDQLQIHDIVSWTSLITGYTQHECIEEAFNCYEEMQHDGISPDPIIFVCILKACSSIGAIEKGKQIHGEIVRQGFLERGNLVGNALVDMYAKCGVLTKAQETFDELSCQDVFTWNAIISGYSEHGHCEKALHCFLQMQNEGLLADASIFCSILKVCKTFGAIEKGKQIHAQVLKEERLLENDSLIGNALMDMYIKCCSLSKAQEVLDGLVSRDIVPWNTMIAGYVQHGDGEEALTCFEKMPKDDLVANPFTFVCILKACGSIGALDKGREIHVEIVQRRLLDMPLSTALVEMYARCGSLVKAQQVFNELPVRDVVSWTILLAGFAHIGNDVIVIHQLENMLREGIEPDEVTFTVLFNVCSHSGQPDKAQMYFETMITYYDIIPTLEHYTCMVDLFSRARHFDKAIVLIASMPIHDYIPIWTVLLGACQQCGNLELGNYAFEHAMQLDEKYATAYVCMSNIYATMTIQED